MLTFAFAHAALAASWAQQKMRSGHFPVRSACMMPPQGHLIRIGVKGAETMTKESDEWANALEAFVETHLKLAGISTSPAPAALDSGASNEELNQVLLQIEQKFESVSKQMDKEPKGVGKSLFSLSDQVAMLPCSAKSDLLVFVQGVGQELTGGRAVMTFAIGGPAEGAALLVTLADAKSGEILALVRVREMDPFFNDAERTFGEQLDREFANINLGAARRNASARPR